MVVKACPCGDCCRRLLIEVHLEDARREPKIAERGEPHRTHGVEHGGKWRPIHCYSLCWAPYKLYEPKTAEQLAALRATRTRNKAEREEREYAEKYPLFAWAGIRPPE